MVCLQLPARSQRYDGCFKSPSSTGCSGSTTTPSRPKPRSVTEAAPIATFTLPARLEDMRLISELLHRVGREAGLSAGDLIDLELAVIEAANNVVIHGFGPNAAEGELEV